MEISGFRILDSLSAELLRPGLTVPAMRNTFKVEGTISNLTGTCPATTFEDAVAITRQMKALNVNPRMVGLTVGVDLPKFYEVLGRDAEFVYGATAWVPELVELRAGGLIPIARQYPGAREFVESYKKEFPGADLSLGLRCRVRRLSDSRRGHQARRVAGQREAPRRHSEDGPQHRLRRIPGRSGWAPDRAQEC